MGVGQKRTSGCGTLLKFCRKRIMRVLQVRSKFTGFSSVWECKSLVGADRKLSMILLQVTRKLKFESGYYDYENKLNVNAAHTASS